MTKSQHTTGELDLDFFRTVGFSKRQCVKCGSYYWSSDPGRKTCGDPPCDSYSFIGNSPVWKAYTLKEMREAFLSFFRDTHTILNPYPVVPRWRNDVLLVNASIYNFQPHVTSGRVKPPGNPIAMSQPSIRMVDTDLVGETGRHLTCFEMLCHDSFNYRDSQVYWKEETTRYCHDFLTGTLKVKSELVTYKEKPWSGGGNGGNAFEVFVSGVEVATLVFMDLKEDPDGKYVIDGRNYSKMDLTIVDTGYGLERLTWLSQGTPTVYQAVMPDALQMIQKHNHGRVLDNGILPIMSSVAVETEPFNRARMIERTHEILAGKGNKITREDLERSFEFFKSIFVLADHTKTLMVLFSDRVIPSNVKVGYLARLLIRRSMRALEELQIDLNLVDLIREQWTAMSDIFPVFPEKFVIEAISTEETKFADLSRKAKGIVLRQFDRNKRLDEADLVTLYDSYGIVPETAASILLAERGKMVEIPDEFISLVVNRHDVQREQIKEKEEFPDIFTRPLYYDDATMRDFNALVLFSRNNNIITNQTAFYPEGGGQPWDTGYFQFGARDISVKAVEKFGNAVVHRLDYQITKGSWIIRLVEEKRRRRLMVHHSATHLVLGVLREVLGDHVWQSGVQKGTERSRIDITHFRKLSDDEINLVEKKCLQYITENHQIKVRNIEWNQAISKYGFRLFEGGVPDGKEIRVVEIEGIDAEGCGGTHLKSTGEIGFLKIIRVETIQEGIQRVTFAAGEAALEYIQGIHQRESAIESLLSVKEGDTPDAVKRLLEENLELIKDVEKRSRAEVEATISSANRFDSKDGQILFMRAGNEDRLLKPLISAVFSRKVPVALIYLERDGEGEVRIMSNGNGISEYIGRELSKRGKGNLTGEGRHLRVTGLKVRVDESLIKEIIDSF